MQVQDLTQRSRIRLPRKTHPCDTAPGCMNTGPRTQAPRTSNAAKLTKTQKQATVALEPTCQRLTAAPSATHAAHAVCSGSGGVAAPGAAASSRSRLSASACGAGEHRREAQPMKACLVKKKGKRNLQQVY